MTDRSASRIADLWVWLTGLWRRQNDRDELTVSMLARLNHLENRMSLTDAALAELDAATNEVAADLDALEAQIASLDADAASKISAAAARLRGLAADPEQPPTLPVLRKFVREAGLAEWKLPDVVKVIDGFPETGVGKVSRKQLRELLAQN